MPHSLDKIDTQILTILQKDSNRTTKSIAEELGMTTSPVFERIKKLEKEGFIKKVLKDNNLSYRNMNIKSPNNQRFIFMNRFSFIGLIDFINNLIFYNSFELLW